MNEFSVAIFGILVGLVILQAFPVVTFISLFHTPNQQTIENDQLPKAGVVLCLRGADPCLADCVRALLNQNYPHYKLQIVVDSREDPAWKIVNEVVQGCLTTSCSTSTQAKHVQVSLLTIQYETCSLKCSAVCQAISELDDSYEVVALVDADVVAHPDWLRELVAPLADERVGATTGYRWYMPPTLCWGSLVRYLWNSASAVAVYSYKYTWGGSMALKLTSGRRLQLIETWMKGLCEDVPLNRVLQEQNLTIKFVPTLIMVNREECDLTSCLLFIARQFLLVRLYHPSWIGIVFHVFVTTAALVLAIVLLLMTLVSAHFVAAAWVGSGFIGYILAMGLLFAFMEQGVQRIVQARGEPTLCFSAKVIAKILLAMPLAQLVGATAVVSATLMRNVKWREIDYQIKGPWNIRLIEYYPYRLSNLSTDTNTSLI